MRYISTRGAAPVLSFSQAMMTGLARDGGLYVPEVVPVLSQDEIAALAGLSYEETAFRVMWPFLGDTFSPDEFRSLIARANYAAALVGGPDSGRSSAYDPAAQAKRHGFSVKPADVLTFHHRLLFGTDPSADTRKRLEPLDAAKMTTALLSSAEAQLG